MIIIISVYDTCHPSPYVSNLDLQITIYQLCINTM